ncbi:protein MATERNALLY EXPRESSED5 [Sesamum angolense]|uniref:Protein MATERNALLY EXPRESSED5 n=1 Tax=Sesamum angolense TaxID=2727404 RepID=A0AAE1X3V0_9LAMI|nr:protein MATERNALLY EXPRESSED5 [Sesamum angolense]
MVNHSWRRLSVIIRNRLPCFESRRSHSQYGKEVTHIFRPFVGFMDLRLVKREARQPGGQPVVLNSLDIFTLGLQERWMYYKLKSLHADPTHKEVTHIFRPFVGYMDLRLVKREDRQPGGQPVVLNSLDIFTPVQQERWMYYKAFDRNSYSSSLFGKQTKSLSMLKSLRADLTRREVMHIFRPFVGYMDLRLVKRKRRQPGGQLMVLSSLDFVTRAHAARAMDVQGTTIYL